MNGNLLPQEIGSIGAQQCRGALNARQLVELQENERRHIARELHDEVGQLLTGLKLGLEMAMRSPADTAAATLGEALEAINELIARVCDLSLDLRPVLLDDLGLLPALLWYCERYTARIGVRVRIEHSGLNRRFRPAVETAAYRIVQEALTNVARHAGTNEVSVCLWTGQGTLSIQVEDQGAGFDPERALASADSSGLTGMRERARLLGGELIIDSAPSTGTRLTALLPVGQPIEMETDAGDDPCPGR